MKDLFSCSIFLKRFWVTRVTKKGDGLSSRSNDGWVDSCTEIDAPLFFWGDSLALHCTSLLRTIFASLAYAHERVCVQNVRDFHQAKLDSQIDARFLLNEHGEL